MGHIICIIDNEYRDYNSVFFQYLLVMAHRKICFILDMPKEFNYESMSRDHMEY
jgi:hypothetical protein